MDTFRRCLSPGKTRERFVDLIPGYGSLYSINHKIELFWDTANLIQNSSEYYVRVIKRIG